MKHIKGDIFDSNADAILHQVNCQGVMGAGLAKQVREKYPVIYHWYKALCDEDKKMRAQTGQSKSNLLGRIQVCYKENYLVGHIEDSQVIVNLFAQDRYGRDGRCYTDYEALEKCLKQVNKCFSGKTVAIPCLMGCGLAGGDWAVVSDMISKTLTDCDVIFYEYSKEKDQAVSVSHLISDAEVRSAETGKPTNSKAVFVKE